MEHLQRSTNLLLYPDKSAYILHLVSHFSGLYSVHDRKLKPVLRRESYSMGHFARKLNLNKYTYT